MWLFISKTNLKKKFCSLSYKILKQRIKDKVKIGKIKLNKKNENQKKRTKRKKVCILVSSWVQYFHIDDQMVNCYAQ